MVDDEAEVRGLLADLLAAAGQLVETVANGAEALDRLRERRYDLVLSDVRMPEPDGPGLYREIERRHPRLSPSRMMPTSWGWTPGRSPASGSEGPGQRR